MCKFKLSGVLLYVPKWHRKWTITASEIFNLQEKSTYSSETLPHNALGNLAPEAFIASFKALSGDLQCVYMLVKE